MSGFCGKLDFELNERKFWFSEDVVLPLDNVERDVTLDLSAAGSETGLANCIEVWGMKLVFMQERNGLLYAFRVGAAKLLESFGGEDFD